MATRPLPSSARGGMASVVPFDWRLTLPTAPSDYPWTDFGSPTGAPQQFVEKLVTYALELEDTLATPIILSLFTDARASLDDMLPANETNRRGWVGDEFMASSATDQRDDWGTLLWLYYTGKVTDDVLGMVEFTCKEGLRWLIRAGIASRVDVTALWTGEGLDRLAVRPQIYKPNQVTPVYDVLWGTSIRRFGQ
ncbi:phage GP46 family protein [Polaromonas sp. UC242_47]